jgi:two-component system cell cycle response regulator
MSQNNTVLEEIFMSQEINILIVEDSPTQAAQLKYMLEQHGYRVSVAKNGEAALASTRQDKPTIVISDVVMPEMNGYELCQHIKTDENLRDTPVILLTQLSDPQDIIRGLECGADNFITKPYDEDFLLSRIKYILVNCELRQSTIYTEMGMEIFFAGQKHFVTSDRMQILDLLFSMFENVIQKNRELEQANKELKAALETVKTLRGLIPICSNCKKIRDDKGYWHRVEVYIQEHSEADFSHSICPECTKKLYPDVYTRMNHEIGTKSCGK